MTDTKIIPTIPPEIEAKRAEIVALCQRFGVVQLDMFGSSTIGGFDPETSDYDFIIDLGAYAPGIARRFFGFEEALQSLLGRPVDLNAEPNGRNPYYMEAVAESRISFYEP
jgi:predicted nucleotidyltransferase